MGRRRKLSPRAQGGARESPPEAGPSLERPLKAFGKGGHLANRTKGLFVEQRRDWESGEGEKGEEVEKAALFYFF